MMFAEKYRPEKFEEVIGLNPEIPKFVEAESTQPMIFTGPPGTGKTTTALIIAKYRGASSKLLNASDERGIDVIRNKVSEFAMTTNVNAKRVMILDEADRLTSEAQDALRGVINKYQENCHFIITCNYFYKLSDALKSRNAIFEFKAFSQGDMVNRLKFICEKEGITCESNVLQRITEIKYPDIRSAIVLLEMASMRYDKKIPMEYIMSKEKVIPCIMEQLQNGSVLGAEKILTDEYHDLDVFVTELSDYIFYERSIKETIRRRLMVNVLGKYYYEMSRVKNMIVILRPMLYEMMKVLKEE